MSDYRDLEDIGLGQLPQTIIFLISCLSFVGIVIGISYSIRKNRPTRSFGRRLLGFSLILHTIYLFCICPLLVILPNT